MILSKCECLNKMYNKITKINNNVYATKTLIYLFSVLQFWHLIVNVDFMYLYLFSENISVSICIF